jgi:hypothetical protein
MHILAAVQVSACTCMLPYIGTLVHRISPPGACARRAGWNVDVNVLLKQDSGHQILKYAVESLTIGSFKS